MVGADVLISAEAKPSLRSKSLEQCGPQSHFNEISFCCDYGAPGGRALPLRVFSF